MRVCGLGLAAAALLVGPSCESVPTAKKDSPRVEAEVALEVQPAFAGAVSASGATLAAALRGTVMDQADVGLRFYPVARSEYGKGDKRPALLMAVQLTELEVVIGERELPRPEPEGEEKAAEEGAAEGDAEAKAEAEPAPAPVEKYAKQVRCGVRVTITRRRADGPALTIGTSEAKGSASVGSFEGEGDWVVVHDAADTHPVGIRNGDLEKALDAALKSALSKLVKPIDRELALNADKVGAAPQR